MRPARCASSNSNLVHTAVRAPGMRRYFAPSAWVACPPVPELENGERLACYSLLHCCVSWLIVYVAFARRCGLSETRTPSGSPRQVCSSSGCPRSTQSCTPSKKVSTLLCCLSNQVFVSVTTRAIREVGAFSCVCGGGGEGRGMGPRKRHFGLFAWMDRAYPFRNGWALVCLALLMDALLCLFPD